MNLGASKFVLILGNGFPLSCLLNQRVTVSHDTLQHLFVWLKIIRLFSQHTTNARAAYYNQSMYKSRNYHEKVYSTNISRNSLVATETEDKKLQKIWYSKSFHKILSIACLIPSTLSNNSEHFIKAFSLLLTDILKNMMPDSCKLSNIRPGMINNIKSEFLSFLRKRTPFCWMQVAGRHCTKQNVTIMMPMKWVSNSYGCLSLAIGSIAWCKSKSLVLESELHVVW